MTISQPEFRIFMSDIFKNCLYELMDSGELNDEDKKSLMVDCEDLSGIIVDVLDTRFIAGDVTENSILIDFEVDAVARDYF